LDQNWSKLSYVGPTEDAQNAYSVSNANGANGRSPYFQSPGILSLNQPGKPALPFINHTQSHKSLLDKNNINQSSAASGLNVQSEAQKYQSKKGSDS